MKKLTLVLNHIDLTQINLEKFFKKAKEEVASYKSTYDLCCKYFAIIYQDEIPIAKISSQYFNIAQQRHFIIRADPVQLKVDIAGVYLLGQTHLDFSKAELDSITSDLRNFLKEDGIILHSPDYYHWFLDFPKTLLFKSFSHHDLLGKEISSYMIFGEDAKYLKHLQTEIQMFLYHHPVNQERERHNQPLINHLWFHGEGDGYHVATSEIKLVMSNEPDTLALAKAANINIQEIIGDDFKFIDTHENIFIYLSNQQNDINLIDLLQNVKDKNFLELEILINNHKRYVFKSKSNIISWIKNRL